MSLRAPVDALAAGAYRLPGAVAHYVTHVRRLRAGDAFVLFCPASGREADATLVSVADEDAGGVMVEVGALRTAADDALSVTLVYALAKGDKVAKVVQDATELGARGMIIVETERAVVKLDAARAASRTQRWERISLDAARQCGRTAPLRIVGPLALSTLGDGELGPNDETALRVVLSPSAPRSFGSLVERALAASHVVLAIGPEGGFSTEEVASLAQRGFHEAHLGARILRTETVAAAVLGALQIHADRARDAASDTRVASQ